MVNGIVLVLIACNSALAMFGAFYFFPRLIAMVLNLFLTAAHFCCVIATAVFRFRALGKLCALSIQPTKKDNVEWTYRNDAALIAALWAFQFVLFVPFFFAGAVPLIRRRPKVADGGSGQDET